jgi:anthranilate phosphoribosyltransferase
MSQVLVARGIDHAILVNSDDGLDELSLGASSTLHVVNVQSVDVQRLDAGARLGLRHSASAIRGGDTEHNVGVTRAFLAGQPGPVFDVVCANASLALIVAGRATTLIEGFEQASASVTEGRAAVALERLVELSNS